MVKFSSTELAATPKPTLIEPAPTATTVDKPATGAPTGAPTPVAVAAAPPIAAIEAELETVPVRLDNKLNTSLALTCDQSPSFSIKLP